MVIGTQSLLNGLVNTMKKICIFMLLLSLAAGADDHKLLVTTTNDRDDAIDVLHLQVDDKNKAVKVLHWRGDKYWEYNFAQLDDGVLLRQKKNTKVVELRSLDFDPVKGGVFRIRYLYSGLPPFKYKNLDLKLRPSSDGWHLFDASSPVANLHLEVNRLKMLGLNETIGIKEITPQSKSIPNVPEVKKPD